MTVDELEKGNGLLELIDQEQGAIEDIKLWLESTKAAGANNSVANPDASFYNMFLVQHADGSGFTVNLSGYHNNRKILEAILGVLEQRLAEYTKEFTNL